MPAIAVLTIENEENSSSLVGIVARRLVNIVTHVFIGILCYALTKNSLAYVHIDYKILWHMILCSFGYIFFMAEGLLVFSPDNTYLIQRKSNKNIHLGFLAVGVIISLIGTAVMWIWKNEFEIRHFRTFHAITGLVSLVLAIVACFNGLVLYYARRMFPNMRPVVFKSFHYVIGILSFGIGMISIAYKIPNHTPELVYICYLICVSTLFYPVISCAKSIKRTFCN